MVVEKTIGGRPVFLSYLPAGSYVGEMALIDGGPRTATIHAAIKSEVIRLDGAAFARLLVSRQDPVHNLQRGRGVFPAATGAVAFVLILVSLPCSQLRAALGRR